MIVKPSICHVMSKAILGTSKSRDVGRIGLLTGVGSRHSPRLACAGWPCRGGAGETSLLFAVSVLPTASHGDAFIHDSIARRSGTTDPLKDDRQH